MHSKAAFAFDAFASGRNTGSKTRDTVTQTLESFALLLEKKGSRARSASAADFQDPPPSESSTQQAVQCLISNGVSQNGFLISGTTRAAPETPVGVFALLAAAHAACNTRDCKARTRYFVWGIAGKDLWTDFAWFLTQTDDLSSHSSD